MITLRKRVQWLEARDPVPYDAFRRLREQHYLLERIVLALGKASGLTYVEPSPTIAVACTRGISYVPNPKAEQFWVKDEAQNPFWAIAKLSERISALEVATFPTKPKRKKRRCGTHLSKK